MDNTIETTKDIPSQIAETGKVNLTRKEINQQIGELFILRIDIHLQGSVLDAPELMWAEPQLEPIYSAVRSYLEMDQRVALLTERLSVIADLLAVLKDQLTHTHVSISMLDERLICMSANLCGLGGIPGVDCNYSHCCGDLGGRHQHCGGLGCWRGLKPWLVHLETVTNS